MQAPHIVILAAGQGKRMRSRRPKVLHEVLYRPIIHYVLDLARSIPNRSISMIVGHGEAEVRKGCEGFSDIKFFRQDQQLGTGHAVRTTESFLGKESGPVIVLSGDVILIQKASLEGLLKAHAEGGSAGTIATCTVPQPRGYGRILRDANRHIVGIREEADCSPDEKSIREVNTGLYCFEASSLFPALSKLTNDNKQKEYYLPDVLKQFLVDKKPVATFEMSDANEMLGVNDMHDLAQVELALRNRINRFWLTEGVTLQDPASTFIDSRTKIGKDVFIESNVHLIESIVGHDVTIESGTRLVRAQLGNGAVIRQGSYLEDAQLGVDCSVGPYARLRPGTQLGDEVKIGNFVELKKTKMGKGAKASHLSYIGDAEIGDDVNLGCGFITCNYDGVNKHKTVIENGVFVGSDSQVVAPVTIGAGSYVASGTTVTEDVPAKSLVISRGKQITKAGYAAKYTKKK